MALLASAPTLEMITESVTRFYAGEIKTLEVERENVWTVHNPDGMPLIGVRVVKRGKRYRLETVL
jgi:hypothetical protein